MTSAFRIFRRAYRHYLIMEQSETISLRPEGSQLRIGFWANIQGNVFTYKLSISISPRNAYLKRVMCKKEKFLFYILLLLLLIIYTMVIYCNVVNFLFWKILQICKSTFSCRIKPLRRCFSFLKPSSTYFFLKDVILVSHILNIAINCAFQSC